MKKKIVFFGYTLDMGGAERAMLNVIDVLKKYYEIDLILIKKTGELLSSVPEGVNIKEIRKNIFIYVLFRYIPFIRKIIIRSLTKDNYYIAVAFMEGRCATWLTDMKSSCKKIAWIHNDVDKFNIGISDKEIRKTYSKIDEVIIVSKHSKASFCNKYNISEDKVKVIYNLINEKEILEKSEEFIPKKTQFTFVNVAKMRKQKRHDRLIECAKILKDKGYDFEVWLIGNGPLESNIKQLVIDKQVSDCVKLFGLKKNPFPYIKAADFFVMSSDHEGYPLSLLESLLLKTPVISTDVSGAKEIIQGKYGLICDTNVESLASTMEHVLQKDSTKISNNLKNYKGSNIIIKKEIEKLFDIS